MTFVYKTKPWEHQIQALEYLYKRNAAALYTDMGTGKSKVIVDLIINRGFKCVIIAATNKGCKVWQKQFKIHSNLQSNFVFNLAGLPTEEKVRLLRENIPKPRLRNPEDIYVIICNYEGIWRDKFANLLLQKFLNIDAVVCDESHRIKSPSSRCSRFLSKLGARAPNRYLVTGTPLAENPMDVYAQYRFLDPRIFGTNFGTFKERYQNIDPVLTAKVGFPILYKNNPYKNMDELKEKMFSCAFCVKSSLKLPSRRNIVQDFTLSKKAQLAYAELEKEGILEYETGVLEVSNVLTMALRKQQLTSGYVTVEDLDGLKRFVRIDSNRAEVLQDLLQGFNHDEPVVVFAKFKHDLKEIRRVCSEIGRGYSEISGSEDSEADWQVGKTSVIGVQYTSGSESIDLTKARYCIYYSLTNSLAQYLQSKKRIHRPGQTQCVVYYHLIAELDKGKSIDQTILAALKNKQDVIQYIMKTEQRKAPR